MINSSTIIVFPILLLIEILTFLVLHKHLVSKPKIVFVSSLIINLILSAITWYLFIRIATYKGIADNPEYIWFNMSLVGIIIAVWIPRVIVIKLHFIGRLVNRRRKEYSGSYTNAGLLIGLLFFLVALGSNVFGRFNYKVEKVDIPVVGLPADLNGLTIVEISDLHLGGYYRHYDKLNEVADIVNDLDPDIIFNTGDFVSYGWNEYSGADSIFRKMKSRYGNYAIIGNHDIGTYITDYTPEEIEMNIKIMKDLIQKSGYTVLHDQNTIISIGNTDLAIAGVETRGRHPGILHGNLEEAGAGIDSADFKILLSHDPNHWYQAVTGKTDFDITFSGHTHGMQFGIITPWFKWSPSKYFYPEWYGLYKEGDQFLYVNRGLGCMSMPLRVFMPPEITLIKLVSSPL